VTKRSCHGCVILVPAPELNTFSTSTFLLTNPAPIDWPVDGWQLTPDVIVRAPEFRVPARPPKSSTTR